MASVAISPVSGAQRRPGHQPRRHLRRHRSLTDRKPAARALNEGRGINPGDTSGIAVNSACAAKSSRSLNEGRGINPGDTLRESCRRYASSLAVRSTKAGASTPATRAPDWSDSIANQRCGASRHWPSLARRARSKPAQRRPGHQPRRHGCARGHGPCRERSTKAGASTPATHAPHPPTSGLGVERSTKAGASTPATHQG